MDPKQSWDSNPTKIFLRNISPKVSQHDLQTLIEKFYKLRSCKMWQSKTAPVNTAIIEFEFPKEAQDAMDNLNKSEFFGLKLFAEPFRDSNQALSDSILFVQNVPETAETNQMIKLFSTYGTVKNIQILSQSNGGPRSAYVYFAYPEGAQQAIKELQGHRVDVFCAPFVIRFARQRDERRTVLFKNLPMDCDENSLRNLCNNFGEIDEIKMKKDKLYPNKIAKVKFKNAESAAMASKKCNGLEVEKNKSPLATKLVNEQSPNDNRSQEKTKKKCVFFARGSCLRGESCWFSHAVDESFRREKPKEYFTGRNGENRRNL